MDLEQYKKTWKNQNEELKVSKVEIYKMMLKKSSSIVKWILIFSILEFLILGIFSIYFPESEKQHHKYYEVFFDTCDVLAWLINIYFIFLFYKNYTKIKVTENSNSLMKSILKARKTVKNYMYFNLWYAFTMMIIASIYIISTKDMQQAFGHDEFIFYVLLFLIIMIIIAVIIGTYWLIYRLVYGTLLKKLNVNYKELRKFEV